MFGWSKKVKGKIVKGKIVEGMTVSRKWDNYLVVWYQRKWKESWRKDRSILLNDINFPIDIYTHTQKILNLWYTVCIYV